MYFRGWSLLFHLGFVASAVLGRNRNDTFSRAIYTLSNNPSGNQILSLGISSNGTVSSPVLTSTNGKGLVGLNVGPPFGTPGSPAGPDSLFGSGAVFVSQNYLFNVNPGSNTLSMFKIHSGDATHPQLMGKPVDTMGEFPTGVTYSDRLHIACVLNGGAKNGVACFTVSDDAGLSPLGNLRPLKNLQTTTPPTGPPNSASDIKFNPSSSALFVITKGTQGPPATSGYLYAFAVDSNGRVSDSPIISSPPKLILDFSINFLGSDTTALITDPAFGASLVTITSSLQISESDHIVIPYQGAACWAAYQPRYDSVYVVDTLHPNITVLDPVTGNFKGAIQYDSSAKGGYDTITSRQWLYLLTGDSSVVVIDLERNGGQEAQHFSLGGEGPPGQWQGMAAYPANEN